MTPDLLPLNMAAKVEVSESGCWLWTGAIQSRGYGSTCIGESRSALAHRVAYTLLVGPIPDGMTIDHRCEVKRCVNPTHLEPVTRAENLRRHAAAHRGSCYCEQPECRKCLSRKATSVKVARHRARRLAVEVAGERRAS
jgi:hypothetical protein